MWTPPVKQAIRGSGIRRVSMYGFCMEKRSPNPQCMRTPDPLRVAGLEGRKAEQVFPKRISLPERGLLAELGMDCVTRQHHPNDCIPYPA
jgi:hypothetical protein